MKINLLSIIINIFLIINIINCNIIGSNYTLKNVRILDTEVSIVSGQVYLDEPLYLLESYTCPDLDSSFCTALYNVTCPPCDYTHSGCSKGYSDRPTFCEPCNTETIPGNEGYYACDQIWTDLELNVPYRGFLSYNYNANGIYRIYTPPDCIGYKVSFKTVQGKANFMLDSVPINPILGGAARTIQSEEIDAQFTLCPNTPSYQYANTEYPMEYPYGTLHIGLINRGSTDYIFDILIEPITIPIVNTSQPTCTQVHPDIPCLNDGQNIFNKSITPAGTFNKYSFEVTECKNITIQTVTLVNDVDLFATDEDPDTFSPNNYKWSSTYSLDDIIIIQVCPEKNQSSKIIYFGLYLFYDSDFYFYISTKGQYKLREITNNPSVVGTWALTDSSYLQSYSKDNDTWVQTRCDNYDSGCIEYFPVYPRQKNNPLYPVPNVFRNGGQGLSQFDSVALNETLNNSVKMVYQFGIILSITVKGIIYNYFDKSLLESTEIVFLNRLVHSNGTLFVGSSSIGNQVSPECDYYKFSVISEEQNSILNKLDQASASSINGLRYYYDVLSIEDDYYSCELMAESYMLFNTTVSIQNTTVCVGTKNETQYKEDPCCSLYATFSQCCRQRPQEITTQTFIRVDYPTVKDQCSFPDCAESVLETFVQSVVGSQYDQCKVSSEQESYYNDNLYSVFRQCKSSLSPPTCDQNSDCPVSSNGTNYQCNSRNGVCLIPTYDVEISYILCILDNIADPLRAEVVRNLNYSSITDKNQLAANLHQSFLFHDCSTEYGVPRWSRLVNVYAPSTEISPYCYPLQSGYDTSGALPRYDNCYQGLNAFSWIAQVYTSVSCPTNLRCDWMGENGIPAFFPSIDDFKNECINNAPDYFCGDCSDPVRSCYTNDTLKTQQDCESKYYCMTRDRNEDITYEPGLLTVSDPSLCADLAGECSVSCGYECDSDKAGCVIPSDSGYCNTINGELGQATLHPDGTTYCAYYLMDSATCATYQNAVYKSCNVFSDDQCTICGDEQYGCDSFGLRCTKRAVPCTTKAQCEAAGVCSDEFYFQYAVSNYPTFQPKCLFPRETVPLFTSSLPTCEFFTEQDTPLGCVYFYLGYRNKEVCEGDGGYWWETYSKNQSMCEDRPGLCYGIDTSSGYLLPLTYRFNEKSQEDCECSGEQWIEPFSWTQGVWTPGVAKQLKWIETNKQSPVTSLTTYKQVLNIPAFFDAFKDAAFSRTTLLYKSEVLCRSSNSKNSLEALSCSCTSDIGDTCFESLQPPVLQVIKPCYDGTNTTIFDNGTLQFPAASISENNCVSISIGQVFKDTFLSKKVLGLSSTFVTFDRPDDYSIFNEKKAVIGKILADGVSLQFYDIGAKDFELCLFPTNSRNSKKFPYLDFSVLLDEKEGEVKALECNVKTDNYGRYCCIIDDIQLGQNSYFLIERIENWQSENYKPFKSGSSAMLYILAVLFMLMAIYGILHLALFILQKILSTEPFKLVHLLFLILTAFCIIRSIYFFILPSGYIKESTTVGNYILVVLPTFLYFTSFTVVIVIWYMLSSAQSFNTNIYKKIYTMIFAINVILYIIFIIIVIVFNFTQENDPPSCGGRLSISLKQTKPQSIVSIFYAVVQAVLSLAIGFAFIYYGRLVYNKLRGLSNNVSSTAGKQKKRTIQMAIICSTGFVLHCIFIIILVSVNPSNIVFSFICLIVTEIIPVVTLFVTNNQIPITRYSKRGVKRVIRLTGRSSTMSVSLETSSTFNANDSSKAKKSVSLSSTSSSYPNSKNTTPGN